MSKLIFPLHRDKICEETGANKSQTSSAIVTTIWRPGLKERNTLFIHFTEVKLPVKHLTLIVCQ